MNQKVVVKMMGKYGHLISIANDGREAVAMFENSSERFECILMDIQMPHMSGSEAAARIRKIEKERDWPYTPIIAVSAYVEEKAKFSQAGIDAYISKPINQHALLEAMCQLTTQHLKKRNDDNDNNENNNNNNTNENNNSNENDNKSNDKQ